jgi:hypothetical protein
LFRGSDWRLPNFGGLELARAGSQLDLISRL